VKNRCETSETLFVQIDLFLFARQQQFTGRKTALVISQGMLMLCGRHINNPPMGPESLHTPNRSQTSEMVKSFLSSSPCPCVR